MTRSVVMVIAVLLSLGVVDHGVSHAGGKRDKASARHKAECEAYCGGNVWCTCSTHAGCGVGYKSIKDFRGYGRNYHACSKRVTAVFSCGEKEHAGEMFAFGVPGTPDGSKLSLSQAKDLVRKYRWIHVNASMKSRQDAKHNAGILSRAVRHPLVLVFMSRSVMDGKRNEYDPNFVRNLGALASHGIGDRKTLLVTARSYGNSQALHVLRQQADSSNILFLGLCPAFGAFGNKASANVKRFHSDVQETKVKYCMIASEGDNYTWRAGGACVVKGGRYQGDEKVCKAIAKNRRNVKVFTIREAGHDNAEYLANGALGKMRLCVEQLGFKGKAAGDIVYGRR